VVRRIPPAGLAGTRSRGSLPNVVERYPKHLFAEPCSPREIRERAGLPRRSVAKTGARRVSWKVARWQDRRESACGTRTAR
jgi:hypothetical protein